MPFFGFWSSRIAFSFFTILPPSWAMDTLKAVQQRLSQIPVARPITPDIRPLLIDRHTRPGSFLFHLCRRPFRAVQDPEYVLARESREVTL